ncbi:unnamed protein product [Urochloa decumbens]|uniref:Uncharacterized protein n=1 Tax=Urochloa decumbens TaxID=240449 RepID=A0ABC8Z7W9_9POAL
MAADGTRLLRLSAFDFSFTIDGAITTVVADDPVEEELARRRNSGAAKWMDGDAGKKRDGDESKKRGSGAGKKEDGDEAKNGDGDAAEKRDGGAAKKRGRNGGVDRREEGEAASGWSSAVVERGLALRRRGGSASCSSRRCGLIVGEGARYREEAAASGALGVGAADAVVADQEALVDPTLAFLCVAVL